MTIRPKKFTMFCLTLAFGLIVGTVPAFSDTVKIEEIPKDGFARIKFVWPAPVPFLARIVGNQLKVSFARKIDSDFEYIPSKLAKYIGRPQLLDGGNTLVFPIKNEYGLNFNARGRTITIDLVDLGFTSSVKVPSNLTIKSFEKVNVRVGQHSDYRRLVFDWKKKVSYKFMRQGREATLIFGRAATIDVSKIE